MKKKMWSKLVVVMLSISMMAVLLAGCGSSNGQDTSTGDATAENKQETAAPAETEAADTDEATQETESADVAVSGEKFKIALSNSFMGNDWRQLMIKTTQVVAEKEPYTEKVQLDIVTCENTAEAQAASIDALVEKGYDAILINAASATALIPAINRATEAGIVVVTFDNTVEAEGVYRVSTDLANLSRAWARYLVAQCGDGANLIVDTGIAGSTSGNVMYEAAMEVFDEHNMNIVSEFASEYADGVGQEQISSVLAANAEIDGVYSLCYADTVYNAFTDAGRELVPTTSFNTNSGMVAAYDKEMNILIGNNIPGLGAVAMSVAVEALEGQSVDQEVLIEAGLFTNDTSVDVGFETTQIEEDVTFFRDLPDAFCYPVLTADFEPQVEAKEVADYQP